MNADCESPLQVSVPGVAAVPSRIKAWKARQVGLTFTPAKFLPADSNEAIPSCFRRLSITSGRSFSHQVALRDLSSHAVPAVPFTGPAQTIGIKRAFPSPVKMLPRMNV